MNIIIRKQETGEVFDVLPEFKLEMRNTSPIFNNLGSKAVTTTIPKTPHNVRLLDYSNRLDIKNKPRLKLPVIVSVGSFVRNGMLYLSSAYNTEKTFGIILAFNEGIMYESMSDILLTELSNLPIVEKSTSDLYEDMNRLLTTDVRDEDLSVFGVTLKAHPYKLEETESSYGETLNRVKLGERPSLSRRTETFVIKDNKPVQIDVPEGYGISPFLRIWKVLELIFSHFGYRINKNPFKSEFQLKRLCVLNNTVDAIVANRLDYRQLMPKVTISEFLQALYCRFGMKVFFDSNRNEVNLVLLRDIFRNVEHERVNAGSLLDIEYTAARQIKLSAARNLDQSSTETDTYEEFLKKYNNTVSQSFGSPSSFYVGGVYYDFRGGRFYQGSTINNESKFLSSIHFDWNKNNEGLEIEEITSIDECLTMRTQDGDAGGSLYYAVDARLAYSLLEVDGVGDESDTENLLAFAYDMDEAYTIDETTGMHKFQGFRYGSIFPYIWRNSKDVLQEDRYGNQYRYALTMVGEYGAFNQFFKEYDAFLRHSNNTVKFKMDRPAFRLSNIGFDSKHLVDHQPVLLDKVDHDLDGSRTVSAVTEARTLRLYEPYDLEKDQHLPVPDPIKYQWVLKDDRDEKIDRARGNLIAEYEAKQEADPSRYRFVSVSEGKILEDPDPPTKTTYWFLPPTDSQYWNGERVGNRKHTCKVQFVCKYEYRISIYEKWQQASDNRDMTVDYKSWFEADVIP
jgi:hypothetical protein